MLAAGVDVGSLYTKVVIVDAKGEVVVSNIIRSGVNYRGAAKAGWEEALAMGELQADDIGYVLSTGYGRRLVSFANGEMTEITCHAKAAKRLFPDISLIVDIGGQDSKVIRVRDNGDVENFLMNDKCAAGTGRFLEVMATALEVELSNLGALSFQSKREVEVSSVCTVFAETEVISLLAEGCDRADIAAAIHRSIAKRVMGMVRQLQRDSSETVEMTGGGAKNEGVVRALEHHLGATVYVAPEPQIMGAWGAALIAFERAEAGMLMAEADAVHRS